MPASFTFPVRVYYEDTDAGGVVFYANYLRFFERARTEWLRAAGVVQSDLMTRDGLMFVVRATQVDYLRPARLDDVLQIISTVERLGRVAIEFRQAAFRNGAEADELIARSLIKVGCVDRATLRPAVIPEAVRSVLETS